MAGERSFQRGAAYFAGGAVVALVDSGEVVKSRVVGSAEYKVTLKAEGRSLAHACTCPVGEDGAFCKHAVAAGLAWLAQQRGEAPAPGYAGSKELDVIRNHVAGLDRAALVDLVMGQVAEDEGLRGRLSASALRGDRDADPHALRDTVRKALAVHGFVDWHGMRRLLDRARPVAELLRGLIADGRTAAAMELADYAMNRGLSAYERTDDSSGSFGGLLREIAALHLDAARKARPDPKALGKAFFALHLRDQWQFFDWSDYAPVLGEAGRETYRALAEKEWAKVPARGPGSERGDAASRFIIARIMERLARERGDTDALVAIKSRELGHSYGYVEIAQILADAKRHDEALAWAERGRAAFRDRLDSRLVDFLVREYRRRKRLEDAVHLAWEELESQPGLRPYQLLKDCAGKTWPAWRDKALARLREELRETERRGGGNRRWMPGGHSLLVEIFLWEGDSGAALEEASTGGCTAQHWLALAKAREKQHPADAAAIYRQRLNEIVARGNNDAYDQAAELVGKVRELMRRAKQESEFEGWLGDVRATHKAKRNFMSRLQAIG